MSKKNDTNTGKKLKISHVRGKLAITICAKLTEAVEKAIYDFYTEHIPGIVSPMKDRMVAPTIRFYNQSDLISFLQPWRQGRSTSGSVYSSVFVEDLPYPKISDIILLFDDTIRIDIEWTAEQYNYKYVSGAASSFDVEISIICLDRQKFLDSLGIEPELEIPQYVDILGNPVSIGDIICITSRDTTQLYLDKVKNLTPYSIVLENGRSITHKTGYENKLVVVSDFTVAI